MIDFTPRQMAALLFFAGRSDRRRRKEDLSISLAAARADKQGLKDIEKELDKEF